MKPSLSIAMASACLCGLLVATASPATTGTVLRVPLDQPTLSDALSAASPGTEIRVSASGSPYTDNIDLVDNVDVIGGFDDTYTISDPATNETIIQPAVDGSIVGATTVGPDVTFAGFTIEGGNTVFGGGLFLGAGSELTVRDCIFRNNFASTAGGAIQIGSGSSAHITNCVIENNAATLRGGGINIVGGSDDVLIEFCTIRACSTATSGQPAGGGGALATAAGIRFERNRVESNHSGRDGGGLAVRADASIRAWGNQILSNVAEFNGGGIFHEGGDGHHGTTTVRGNIAAASGGGVYFQGGSNRFLDGWIQGNGAAGVGGGIYFDLSDDALLKRTEVVGNSAPEGGGVAVRGTPTRAFTFVTIESNTIMGNASSNAGTGGGIHILAGEFLGEIVNNIIAFQASGHGIACVGVLASPNIRSNCVYHGATNPADLYGGDCEDRTGINGNISANPLFCCGSDLTNPGCAPNSQPDLLLSGTSPCLGAGENGVDMGAHVGGPACGSTAIEDASWGKIKAFYR